MKKEIYLQIANSLILALDLRDFVTVGHSRRVAKFSELLAKKLKLSSLEVQKSYLAGLLHDLGKIGIPERILFKPTRLTDAEFQIMKRHPLLTFKILNNIEWPNEFKDIPIITRDHHERLDGSGYPSGIKDINIITQIITIADIFDALSAVRQYKKKREFYKILEILDSESEVKLNKEIINQLKKLKLEDVIRILEPSLKKHDLSKLEIYEINDLKDKSVSRLFNHYYYQKYLTYRTREILETYLGEEKHEIFKMGLR